MTEPIHDNPEFLQLVQSLLLPDEAIEAVFAAHGEKKKFIGITSHRIITNAGVSQNDWAITSWPYASLVGCKLFNPESGLSFSIYGVEFERDHLRCLQPEYTRFAHDLIVAHLVGVSSQSIPLPAITQPITKPKRWF